MNIKPGMPAPDFGLFDTTKTKIYLHDFKGRNVLLLFFPQAFTRVCTKELCMVRDNIGRFQNENVQIIGMSVDSLYTLAQYKESQQYNFPLLSDFNREVSTTYGSIYDAWAFEMKGVSKRSAFVIDKNGDVQYAEVLENAGDEPNYAAIEKIQESLS